MSSRICRFPEMTVSKLLGSLRHATGQLSERFEPLRHQQLVFHLRPLQCVRRDVGDCFENAMSSVPKWWGVRDAAINTL